VLGVQSVSIRFLLRVHLRQSYGQDQCRHLWQTKWLFVCVCVCVCVWERESLCLTWACAMVSIYSTISDDGSLCVWDLSDYVVLTKIQGKSRGICLSYVGMYSCCCCSSHVILRRRKISHLLVCVCVCVCFSVCVCVCPAEGVLSGWSDGFVRCYDLKKGKLLWKIPNAHKGAVNCVVGNSYFIVSGGADGCARVWTRKTRMFATQFKLHGYICSVRMTNCSCIILHGYYYVFFKWLCAYLSCVCVCVRVCSCLTLFL